MKRFISVLLILVCITACASADVDLSSMSFEELIALRNRISEEIVSRPEWKNVEVPAGQWIVGEDIPAGTYSISVTSTQSLVRVWKKAVDDYSNSGLYINMIIKPGSPLAKVKLEDGYIVDVNRTIVISPAGSLGF